MKITKGQLKRIIKEEKAKLLREGNFDYDSIGDHPPLHLTGLQLAFIRHCAGAYVEVGLDDILGEYPTREQMDEILELVNIGK